MTEEMSKLDRARKAFYTIFSIIGIVLLLAGVAFLLGKISVAVNIAVLSLILVYLLHAPVNFLERKGVRRGWGAIIAILMAFVVIFIVCVVIGPLFADQIKALLAAMPGYVTQLLTWLNDIWTQYGYLLSDATVQEWIGNIGTKLSDWASSLASASATGIVTLGTSIGSAFVVVCMSFVAAFWFLKDLPRMGKEIHILVNPAYIESFDVVLTICNRVAGGYIKGVLLASICTGILAGIGFTILGVPYSGVLGLITGVMNVIPMIGPWIGGALAAIIALFVSPLTCIIAIAISVCAQQITDTFITPRIMSSTVELHPVLVLLAIMAGGSVGGIVGMIAAVPLTAAAKALYVYYFERHTGRKLVHEDGAFFVGHSSTQGGVKLDPALDAQSSYASRRAHVKKMAAERQRENAGRLARLMNDNKQSKSTGDIPPTDVPERASVETDGRTADKTDD